VILLDSLERNAKTWESASGTAMGAAVGAGAATGSATGSANTTAAIIKRLSTNRIFFMCKGVTGDKENR